MNDAGLEKDIVPASKAVAEGHIIDCCTQKSVSGLCAGFMSCGKKGAVADVVDAQTDGGIDAPNEDYFESKVSTGRLMTRDRGNVLQGTEEPPFLRTDSLQAISDLKVSISIDQNVKEKPSVRMVDVGKVEKSEPVEGDTDF